MKILFSPKYVRQGEGKYVFTKRNNNTAHPYTRQKEKKREIAIERERENEEGDEF